MSRDRDRRARVEQLLADSEQLVERMRAVAAQLKAFTDQHRGEVAGREGGDDAAQE